mgnify:CR=1 FL=1
MSNSKGTKGTIYFCPICKAEVSVLAPRTGDFSPRCCNMAMEPLSRRLFFYICPICFAEIAILKKGTGPFDPRCCNTAMIHAAA